MRPIEPTADSADQPRDLLANTRLSLAQFAHELNSILDGSMRYIGMAVRMLDDPALEVSAEVEHALAKLQSAQAAMRDMADLLERAMHNGKPVAAELRTCTTLGAAVERALATVQPLAEDARVEITCNIAENVGKLPASVIEPILLNGLRNAIESCAASEVVAPRVELTVHVNSNRELKIVIMDNGRGLDDGDHLEAAAKPGGHGIGLQLCRQIALDIGGRLSLVNVPFGRGAVLQLVIPVVRLSAP